MDLFTREIIGINISRYHNSQLVLVAFIDALNKTGKIPKYIHSDQGSEYDSKEFVDFVLSKKIVISMSRKSSPWENGHQGSFFSTLKLELGFLDRFKEMGELIENIYSTIYYYNNRRIHTVLKMTPVDFRRRFKKPLH